MPSAALLAALALAAPQAIPQDVQPQPPRFVLERPLPSLPGILVDRLQFGKGIAQQYALHRGLQARILWIDATANIDQYNEEAKIVALVDRIHRAGFNTIVLDVKPISGHVVYPSAIAPKLTEWRGRILPAEFDPIPVFLRESKSRKLQFFACMNAFSEGHRIMKVGPAYENVSWQTVLYEPDVYADFGLFEVPVHLAPNQMGTPDRLSLFTDSARIPKPMPGEFAATIDALGRVVDGFETSRTPVPPTIPRNGCLLLGAGDSAHRLRAACNPGGPMRFDARPLLVPIQDRPEQQVPVMTNPLHPEVRRRNLAIVDELVRKYPLDGVLYDDRLRFAGLSADFSPEFRKAFEAWLGRPVARWPEDVYQITFLPNFTRGLHPGPDYENWLIFRAKSIRDYVAEVRKTVAAARPEAQFGVYAGSWYGEYPSFGANYGSTELDAGFWFLSDAYRRTGFAGQLDFLITGCYYPSATIVDSMKMGRGIGVSIEAAGYLTSRVADDRTWAYAGIALDQFRDNPLGLQDALQAACATTQGVMVFDLSHNIAPMWPVFERAFSTPRPAPHSDLKHLRALRRDDDLARKRGVKKPTVIVSTGQAGAGH